MVFDLGRSSRECLRPLPLFPLDAERLPLPVFGMPSPPSVNGSTSGASPLFLNPSIPTVCC